jgi:hypothetical protein
VGGGLAIVAAWLVVDGMTGTIGRLRNGYRLWVSLLEKVPNG